MNNSLPSLLVLTAVAFGISAPNIAQAKSFPGTGEVDFAGYHGCIKLENDHARVVLGPHCGGRLLEYSWDGQNILKQDPAQDGWTYTPGKPTIDPYGGRLDVGPEMTLPRHPDLWFGPWQAKITGPRAARMTSVADKATGLQVTRDFVLDEHSGHLRVTQTVKNLSDKTVDYCHWSRTLAVGNGICLVPVNPKSRFPKGYMMYGPGSVLNFNPQDPNVRVRDGFLEFTAPPEQPKYGIDSVAGWLAYVAPNDLLMVKRFPVYPERVYNEIDAFTVAIYYYKDIMCELEPLGPRETLRPGRSASYTEDWWLLPYSFPKDRQSLDLKALTAFAERNAR